MSIGALEAYRTADQQSTSTLVLERQIQRSSNLSDLKILFAKTEELLQESYRLRYQVYCVENDFEPAAAFPDKMETDEYETQAFHAVLADTKSESILGTVRMIMPKLAGNALPLPITSACDPDALNSALRQIPYNQMAEISRFAISKHLRRNHKICGDANQDVESNVDLLPFGTLSNYISLQLMQALIEMAKQNNITHLCAVMTPSLLRMLRFLAIHFEKIGPIVEYHGRRQPCFINISTMLEGAWAKRPDVWDFLTDGGRLAEQPNADWEIVAAE